MASPKTYHLVTLGCPKNDVDSEQFERLLIGGNLQPAASANDADAIVVNTCGFIEQSQAQSYSAIEDLAAAKRDGQVLVVAGCLTQLFAGEVSQRFPEVDHIFGAGEWPRVAQLLSVDTSAVHDIPQTHVRVNGPGAYLKISDGCDAPCSFCVIPRIKGGLRSAPAGMLVREARALVEAGARELVLVAQDTTAWGEDLGRPFAAGFPGLLETLAEAAGPDVWLRIMYAYPSRVTPQLIETMAALPGVIPYLDVPLQHGSPSVLRRMKRPHNVERVLGMIEDLRSAMPDIVLRTSFIAGHPGETDAEFEELLAFAREASFDHAGCFTYSRQQFTADFDAGPQLPDELKEERRDRLMLQQREISASRAARFIGRTLDVLVEGAGEDGDGDDVAVGRSYREAPEVDGLVIARGTAVAGERARVRIEEAGDYDLVGTVVRAEAKR